MKKSIVLVAMAAFCFVVRVGAQAPGAALSRVGGMFYAAVYNYPAVTVYSGNAATGSQTIVLNTPGCLALVDGRVVCPFSVNNPITIDIGANQETVTPTAVSGCGYQQPVYPPACSITATFGYAHGAGTRVASGTAGLNEAASDAAGASGSGSGVAVVDAMFTGTVAQITAARGLFANVSVKDVRGVELGPITVSGTCTGTATASSTLFLYGAGGPSASTCTVATQLGGVVIPRAGTLRNLSCTASTGGVNASSGVVTVMKNGATTPLTGTFGTGTAAADTTHSAAVAAGNFVGIQFTSQAAETLAGVTCNVQVQ